MEEDKGLDLSLGLPLGGSSSKSKDRNGNSTDMRTDDGDRTSKILNDFRNFLSGGNPQLDPGIFHRVDSVKLQENYFSSISQASVDLDATRNGNGRRVWIGRSRSSAEVEDEKGPMVGEKRKSLLDGSNTRKKQESEARNSDLHDKVKTSHISITTDDGSTAENEDVAESEAEGSTSRLVTHHEDDSKWPVGGGSFSEVPKEIHGKLTSDAPSFSVQTTSTLNVPYPIAIKEPPSVGVPSTSSGPLPGVMQAIPAINIERPGMQTLNAGNKLLMFGYSTVQVPTVDKDNAWGMAACPQQFHPPYAARGISSSAAMQSNPNSSEAVRSSEQAKSEGKQVVEEGLSSHTEDDARGSSTLRGKAASEVPTSDGFPSEYPAIRPGIAADIKFGGSGSLPNLPWVSTTSPGPNGRTISGVTYKFNANQIRIVCACHGSHMSPEEFIQHAAEEQPATDVTVGLPSITSNNPTSSARS